jgi:O-antigen/teichoic acid export membrane protein
MLLISLIANIPRYFIESTEGQSQLGIFAALSYLIVAGNTVVAALGQSASPRLAVMYANGHVAQFRNAVYKLMLAGLAAGVVGAIIALAFGESIITRMYSDEYAQHTSLLFTLAVAGGISFAGSFVGYGVTAARHFGVQVPIFLIVGLVCLGASAVLVPPFGILGGALSILVASLVQLCASVLVIHRATRNRSSAHD